MKEVQRCNLVFGGAYVPDPGAALISIGGATFGGAVAGIPGGPAGMITGAAIGLVVTASTVISVDAYKINQQQPKAG